MHLFAHTHEINFFHAPPLSVWEEASREGRPLPFDAKLGRPDGPNTFEGAETGPDDSLYAVVWIRPVEFAPAADIRWNRDEVKRVTAWGFAAPRAEDLIDKTIDALDPERTTFVELHFDLTSEVWCRVVAGNPDRAKTVGAEPFVIERLTKDDFEPAGTVLARSEAEAARLCKFVAFKHPIRDRTTYSGRLSVDGEVDVVRLTRLRDLPKLPFR